MNYPTAKDDATSLPNPTGTATQNNPDHGALHTAENAAIIALESKLGTGASTPASNTLLVGTGAGTSAFQSLTSAQLAAILSDETGSGSAVFATSPTLITPKVDTINESTVGNGVTVGGVNLKSGVITGNLPAGSVPTAALAAGAVTASKIGTDSSFAWQTWTPTTTNLASITSSTYKFMQIGKTVMINLRVAATGNNSAPTVSLPVTAVLGGGTSVYYETAAGLVLVNAVVQTSPGRLYLIDTTHMGIGLAGGSVAPSTAFEIRGIFIYEAA